MALTSQTMLSFNGVATLTWRPAATITESCLCTLVEGLLMGVSTLAANLAFGGSLDMVFLVNTLIEFANAGALATMPMAALGSSLRFVAAGLGPLPAAATAAPQAPSKVIS